MMSWVWHHEDLISKYSDGVKVCECHMSLAAPDWTNSATGL